MKPFRERAVLLMAGVLLGLLVVVWLIAGSDWLFTHTVSLPQRLVSQNDGIRKKAQQELLGLDGDAKRKIVTQLIPAIGSDNPFRIKWAAIALALVGPSAQEA